MLSGNEKYMLVGHKLNLCFLVNEITPQAGSGGCQPRNRGRGGKLALDPLALTQGLGPGPNELFNQARFRAQVQMTSSVGPVIRPGTGPGPGYDCLNNEHIFGAKK